MLNSPTILEQTRVVDRYSRVLSCARVFHERKVFMEFGIRQKVYILLKKLAFSDCSTVFTKLAFSHLGALCFPFCSLNIHYWTT